MKPSLRKWSAIIVAIIVTYASCFSLLTTRELGMVSSAIAENLQQSNRSASITYTDNSTYSGEIIDTSVRNGTGTLTWSTGEVYSGDWSNGTMNGSGTLCWPNLGSYTGDFVNGRRQGQGCFTWTYDGIPEVGSPISFDGEWKYDQIGATGTLVIYVIGTYTGDFREKKTVW